MKFSKARTSQLLSSARNPYWRVESFGIYIYDGKVDTFINYMSQSYNQIVSQGLYDAVLYIDNEFLNKQEYPNMKTIVDDIYSNITDWIEENKEYLI